MACAAINLCSLDTTQYCALSTRNQILCFFVLVASHHVLDVLAEQRVNLHLRIVEGIDAAPDVFQVAAGVIDVAVFRLVGADGVNQV